MTPTRRALLAALGLSALTATSLEAVVPPRSPLAEKVHRDSRLDIPQQLEPVAQLPPGLGADAAFYDARAGRLSSLIVSEPLVPGTGVGNTLRWVNLGGRPADEGAMKDAVWSAVVGYLQQHERVLRVDLAELSAPRIGILEHGSLIQVYSQRTLNGIPVRDSSVTVIINHGNLVLLGLQNWGNAGSLAAAPQVTVEDARLVLSQHIQPFFINGYRKDAHLEYIPMVSGDGYEYRLAWAIRASVQGDIGTWEGLVDAVSGELIAFEDRNQYARQAIGGVYPVSNDQRTPDGIELAGWPMPFLNVTTPGGVVTTNAAGTIGCPTGNLSTALVGPYARINDACGVINETSAAGDLDLGFGPTPTATDCVVPAGHSVGDTKAARSAFYALTRMNEQARGWLPNNAWLGTSLLANVNMLQTCGAFWNGTSISMFRDGGSVCRNPGEIASILDHEWGHGLDNNNLNPSISAPGEAIADIHSSMRLNTSCIGRGFFRNQVCGGYGDGCIGTPATGCTGVRDLDFALHRCGLPHTITWALSGFTAAQCAGGAPACPAGGGTPCGRATQCEGMIAGETLWDLHARDLRAAPFNFDASTALELGTRLAYLGAQALTAWNTCEVGGGCGATGGYLLFLAADDDDGNLNNGTPHITAIRAAFTRHEIHCATPVAGNTGCVGGPTTAPGLTAVPQDQGVTLSWGAVTGAASYLVYRTEGPNGPDSGKVKIGETTGTTFVDTNLQNGRQYFFHVLPVGTNTSCFGLMSNSVTVTPVGGPNLGVRPGHTMSIIGGDGDAFFDNCERATVTFTVENTGTGTLTNVRLMAVAFLTHPASVLLTPLPAPIAATLADCAVTNGAFSFVLLGATPGQTTQIRVDVTADQLAGQVRSQVITLGPLEQDTTPVAARTYTFDTNLDGWTVSSGAWTRTAPGAQGTAFHVSSTENAGDTCDAISSPAIRLKANSTLALWNRYAIEPTDPVGGPYDRANVGLRDVQTGVRTVIVPSGGQLYTLPPGSINGTCETANQAGWNATSPGFPAFNETTWNAAAFNPGGVFTDRLAQIEIRYGTDPLLHPSGFDYDQVTVTNFDEVVPDVQPNACVAQAVAPAGLAVDTGGNSVMQPNETIVLAPAWRNVGFAAITVTGVTSSFAGPPGAVYTNPDSIASYGTIDVAAQASCSTTGNCYTVLATTATRPVTHWDTTILETVTPTGATKTWTLHIGDSFTDVPPTSGFYRFIETILHKNVTGGCTTTAYCPLGSTTREQMAVFVLVAKEPAGYVPVACGATPMFADVPVTSPFCRWIEELARRGVVSGCGGGNYCPTASATREQMAVFVLRTLDPALNPPACGTPMFSDVPASSPFCRWIEELVRRGVVTGCGGGNYCPTANVRREQMGVFLSVTFGLTLYGL